MIYRPVRERDPEEIVETIATVALNVYTNLLGKAAAIDIDFPKVGLLDSPARKAA